MEIGGVRCRHALASFVSLAPAAAAIASGLAPESTAARAVLDPVRLAEARARTSADGRTVEAEVLVVDRFGNAVLHLCPGELAGTLDEWFLEHRGTRVGFTRTYALVDPGEVLLLVDSYDAVEIAVRDGHAASSLGLSPGDRVTLRRQA